jgi:uncharacterized protein (TIGR03067 family)
MTHDETRRRDLEVIARSAVQLIVSGAFVLILLTHVRGADPHVFTVEKSQHPLVGTWRIERLLFPSGERAGAKGTQVTFDTSRMAIHWARPDGAIKYKYVINDKKAPATIDLVLFEPEYPGYGPIKELGIYRIRGDLLELCLGGHTRPTEIAAPRGLGGINTEPSHPILYVLRRMN